MPGRGRGRKRKAAASLGDEEARLSQPDPGNFGQNVIDFEEILRASNILPTDSFSNEGHGDTANFAAANNVASGSLQNQNEGRACAAAASVPNVASGSGQTHVVGAISDFNPFCLPASNLSVTQSVQPDMLANTSHELLRLSNEDISAHVPSALKQQIAKGEFINLALLLKGSLELKEIVNSSVIKLSAQGMLEAKPKECKDKIPNIEKWTDAILIFVSIYLSTHPDKIYEMLHYIWSIRECATRQGGFTWREYDEQFRMRQALHPTSWAMINNDLWWRCVQVKGNNEGSEKKVFSKPRNTCHQFNEGVCTWSNCKFAHVCSQCGLPHPAALCTISSRLQAQALNAGTALTPRFNAFRRGAMHNTKQGRGRGFGRGSDRK